MERSANSTHVSDPIMQARAEGYKSFHAQGAPSDNPYPRYSEEYFAWLRGWFTEASMEMLSKSR